MADHDNKKIIEDEFPKEVDEFIDNLIEEGYDIEDIEAVLTDEDFLAKLDDLDTEYENEDEEDEGVELLGEISKKKLGQYVNKAVKDATSSTQELGAEWPRTGEAMTTKKREVTNKAGLKYVKRETGISQAVDKLTGMARIKATENAKSSKSAYAHHKEETETMMKSISKGKLGFGKVTPILANAAYCAIKRMPEDERAGVIESVWDDQDAFRLLITSQN